MVQYSWFQSVVIFLYLYYYGPPPIIRYITRKLYINFSHMMNEINKNVLASFDVLSEYDITEEEAKNKEEQINSLKKYEDKYLEEIRKMSKEFDFTEEENKMREEKKIVFYTTSVNNYTNEIKEVDNKLMILNKKMDIINTIIEGDVSYQEEEAEEKERWIRSYTEPFQKGDEEAEQEDNLEPPQLLENVDQNIITDLDEYDPEFIGKTKEECIEYINEEINKLKEMKIRMLTTIETKEGQDQLLNSAIEIANTFILNKHLERLENCFVLETTPHGNVLMIFDNKRGSFKYYSDNTIPYRYLEPVARKYVKQFNCRPLYVDMEEELKLAEEKWEKERKEKEEKEEEEKMRKEEAIRTQQPIEEKKNVFAKFKTYNKEAGSGRVNTGAPPKNSIPNNKLTKEQENEKILLKEKANRYTYEGKFANFSFLKKVERKVVDKKYGLSFADFKKMCKNK